MFLEIEAGLCVLAVGLAFTVAKLSSSWFEALERRFGRLADRSREGTQVFLAQNFPISTDTFRATGG
jgi:hypothetical protein